jgi:5-oxoprolinase (ATP-hydrolysing)
MAGWRFFIDRGGTFTDCLAIAPNGSAHSVKVLSTADAPIVAIRKAMELSESAEIPPCTIRMGTTIATNALLERSGARTVLVVTEGFKDVLAIGTQARPEIFALHIEKPPPLCDRVLETRLRADHLGHAHPCEADPTLLSELKQARADGFESVAIVVLNGHLAPQLERTVESLASEAGFEHVSMSHECASEQGLLKRAQTTVIDAYLGPALARYFERLGQSLAGSRLLVMQSSGNLATPKQLRGPQALLSGPAGGVVACERLVQEFGWPSAVGFDMGGTSTDVCRVEPGRLPRTFEIAIGGATAVSPSLDVHTVAAGGGSICSYDAGRFQVGPASAGAIPGPACYGHASAVQLTITDVNLLLGRLVDLNFPFVLDREAARTRANALHGEVKRDRPTFELTEMLSGLLRIANYNMAEAIREVSLRRGFDVRKETLIVFGGAGGQHACAIARELGIRRVLFPVHAGILSACGMAYASHSVHLQQDSSGLPLEASCLGELDARFGSWLEDQPNLAELSQRRQVDLRYMGSEARITVDFIPDAAGMRETFHRTHERMFGYARPNHTIEVVALRLEVIIETATDAALGTPSSAAPTSVEARAGATVVPRATATMFTCDGWHAAVPIYDRDQLETVVEGPACILDQTGGLVVEPGWSVAVVNGHLVCTDTRPTGEHPTRQSEAVPNAPPDPIMLELMGQAFMGIARQMGVLLQRTASSTNIRERLDYSCAVFDRTAALVANAPHIPVHLGAMGETVKHVASLHTPRPGDVFVSNDPVHGGSHLPDITVVTPVFGVHDELRYWVANRGHHADVGGITPGSMPAFSSSLDEEGVLLSALRLVQGGKLRDDLTRLFTAGRFPARNPQQNIQDLEAQVAANHLGAQLLLELETRFGTDAVPRYMAHLQDHAAKLTEDLIRALPEHDLRFTDRFDDGGVLCAALVRRGDKLRIQFTAPGESDGNANAPRAVTVAAVLYVLRCLLGTRLPLNAGCLRPIDLDIPTPSLLSPGPSRAVCSGNVETSQRVVDVLLGALNAAAASQGTMNNVTFGNATFGYYETLAGGAGAGPTFDGADGVHTHMTNTRVTDPEVLEARYPVRVRRFELRPNSGGKGRFSGGAGCVREYEFLMPLSVTLVSERRESDPFGLAGGLPGARGANYLNGRQLPGRCQVDVMKGDVLRIETPGGGGFGPPTG